MKVIVHIDGRRVRRRTEGRRAAAQNQPLEGWDMRIKHSWDEVQAAAEVCIATILGALPLAALHWLASRYAEG